MKEHIAVIQNDRFPYVLIYSISFTVLGLVAVALVSSPV